MSVTFCTPSFTVLPFTPDPKTICAFCKGSYVAKHLITCPDGLNVCLECVDLLNEIASERKKEQREEAVKEMLNIEKAMEGSYQPVELMYRLYDTGFRQINGGGANG